jgi:hypothetical protein
MTGCDALHSSPFSKYISVPSEARSQQFLRLFYIPVNVALLSKNNVLGQLYTMHFLPLLSSFVFSVLPGNL